MTYDEIYEQLQAEYDRVIADTLDRLKKEMPLTKKKLAKELFKANKAYWAARLALLDTDAVAEADALAGSLAMPYASAAVTYSDRVKNIYAGYQSAFDLSQKDAKELLKHVVYDRTIAENLKAVAEEMTDEEEKQRILAEISAPAYRYRLQRAEKLTRQAKDVCDRIAGSEIEADRGFLQTQIEKAYNITVDEVLGKPPSEAILDEILPEPIQLRFNEMPKASEPVQEFSPTTDKGILDSFSVISDERVREIAGTDWSGREFSESVWNNTDDLAKEIKQVLIKGELTGASEGKMSEKIVERFGVAMHKARRVVRTEQNYCINQTELKGMLDAGYDEYEFASLGEEADGVCHTCNDLDGMRFKIADAVVGVNCPPMHPFCRCKVTTPVQTEDDIRREIDERIESWNIPEGMSFDEFVERVNNGELEEIRKEQDSALNSAQESAEENLQKMLTGGDNGDIIKENDMFFSLADPMEEVTGSGEVSNPEEIAEFRAELKSLGVGLVERDNESLGYSPALRAGEPGTVYVSNGASYSAWLHEMQHVRDDYSDGWSGMKILENPDKRFEREVRAYEKEFEQAEKAQRPDILERLKNNLEEERRQIYGE